MPRGSDGNYTLPAGNPVADSTVISSTWANPTMGDIANEITQSLDRNGRGGMLVPFKNVDGTKAAPGITFTSEVSSGLYRVGTNDIRMSIGNDDTTRWVDASAQTVGEQEPFLIWNGSTFEAPLSDGSSPTFNNVTVSGNITLTDAGSQVSVAGVLLLERSNDNGVVRSTQGDLNLNATGNIALLQGVVGSGEAAGSPAGSTYQIGASADFGLQLLGNGNLSEITLYDRSNNIAMQVYSGGTVGFLNDVTVNTHLKFQVIGNDAYVIAPTNDLFILSTFGDVNFSANGNLNFNDAAIFTEDVVINGKAYVQSVFSVAGGFVGQPITLGRQNVFFVDGTAGTVLSSQPGSSGQIFTFTEGVSGATMFSITNAGRIKIVQGAGLDIGNGYIGNSDVNWGLLLKPDSLSGGVHNVAILNTAGAPMLSFTELTSLANFGGSINVLGDIVVNASSFARTLYQINTVSIWSTGLRSGDDYYIYRDFGAGRVVINASLTVGDGTAIAPSYSFGSETALGMYRAGNGVMGFTGSGFWGDGNGGAGDPTGQSFSISTNGSITGRTSAANVGMFLNATSWVAGLTFHVDFRINGASIGSISNNGSSVAYNVGSDPLLKTEFVEITTALDRIQAAHEAGAIGEYEMLTDLGNKQWGYNAQWLGENQPNTGAMVRSGDRTAVMDYGRRTPTIEAGLYELMMKVEALREELIPTIH